MAGVYLHIPFCRQKCGYCDFYSLCAGKETMDAYVRAVSRQLADFSAAHPGLTAETVYFGGGTPSLLGADALERLLDAVFSTFCVQDGAEITLEANPGELCLAPADGGAQSARALARYRRAGFNRLSMGVQSAHDEELRLLGRRHNWETAVQAVTAARDAGFSNYSLDLMYALPDQTEKAWMQSVEALIGLAPAHLSCYALKLSTGAPLYPLRGRQPDEDTQLSMYLSMVSTLEAAGYRQYEISNFARDGQQSRHNSAYWTGAPYFGFGPGAHSFDGARRYAVKSELSAYLAAERTGDFPITVLEEAADRDPAEEYLMLGLRTTRGLCAGDFKAVSGLPFHRIEAALVKYVPLELVRREADRILLTPRGMFVSNALIVEALEALDETRAHQS